jgi:hypothetical protein
VPRSPPPYPFPKGTNLFSLFQISLETYFDIKFRLWNEFKLAPDWIETLPYWEFQLWIDKLNEHIEKKNSENSSGDGKVQVFNLTNHGVR